MNRWGASSFLLFFLTILIPIMGLSLALGVTGRVARSVDAIGEFYLNGFLVSDRSYLPPCLNRTSPLYWNAQEGLSLLRERLKEFDPGVRLVSSKHLFQSLTLELSSRYFELFKDMALPDTGIGKEGMEHYVGVELILLGPDSGFNGVLPISLVEGRLPRERDECLVSLSLWELVGEGGEVELRLIIPEFHGGPLPSDFIVATINLSCRASGAAFSNIPGGWLDYVVIHEEYLLSTIPREYRDYLVKDIESLGLLGVVIPPRGRVDEFADWYEDSGLVEELCVSMERIIRAPWLTPEQRRLIERVEGAEPLSRALLLLTIPAGLALFLGATWILTSPIRIHGALYSIMGLRLSRAAKLLMLRIMASTAISAIIAWLAYPILMDLILQVIAGFFPLAVAADLFDPFPWVPLAVLLFVASFAATLATSLLRTAQKPPSGLLRKGTPA